MNDKLENRLNALGKHLYSHEGSIALLALGSCAETSRMDEYSDLDFFVIVKEGYKKEFLIDLDWLEAISPLAYYFRNTIDGYKVMWKDGVYAEFAIFELDEMPSIAFSPGRFIFKKKGVELSNLPTRKIQELRQDELSYALNEILTNLYVGLGRYRRGEILSAHRLICVHAVDRYLSILPLLDDPTDALIDPFALDRRVEFRHPAMKDKLSSFVKDYDHVLDGAKALYDELQKITEINETLRLEIEKLI
jgi:lincosamide nucleotidyltransferase B/F